MEAFGSVWREYVKPSSFEYRRAWTPDDAVRWLADSGSEAKLIAGGQSLAPMLNLRLARPKLLIDISRLDRLRYVEGVDRELRIGALSRHAEVEVACKEASEGYRVLAEAASSIGHWAIRQRGTFGGSIAHADPRSEWCALSLALDATISARRVGSERRIPVEEFFVGFLESALHDDEMLVGVDLGPPPQFAAAGQFARRHGDFAVVLVAVALDLSDGLCDRVRIVVGGVDSVPIRVEAGEQVMVGEAPGENLFEEVAHATARAIEPGSDGEGSATYRRELATTLVQRVLGEALTEVIS